MSEYKKIMLAVDLTEESLKVAERATQLVNAFDAELHVVHVIEPLSLAYGGDVPMDLSTVQEQIQDTLDQIEREVLLELFLAIGWSALLCCHAIGHSHRPVTSATAHLSPGVPHSASGRHHVVGKALSRANERRVELVDAPVSRQARSGPRDGDE